MLYIWQQGSICSKYKKKNPVAVAAGLKVSTKKKIVNFRQEATEYKEQNIRFVHTEQYKSACYSPLEAWNGQAALLGRRQKSSNEENLHGCIVLRASSLKSIAMKFLCNTCHKWGKRISWIAQSIHNGLTLRTR